jgi:tetratricopeptide (TPR) repeat protein
VDLEAAEQAFVSAAEQARGVSTMHAAQAFVGAGKAVYAEGRLKEAADHYRAALSIQVQCSEANYQMARLRRHAGDLGGAQKHFSAALDCHWSFAIRAATDSLFTDAPSVVRGWIVAEAGRMQSDMRAEAANALARINFLRRNADRDYPLDLLPSTDVLVRDLRAFAEMPGHTSLKPAFQLCRRERFDADRAVQLAQHYLALLLRVESAIIHRDLQKPEPPKPADLPGVEVDAAQTVLRRAARLARWLSRRRAVLGKRARIARNRARLRKRVRRIQRHFDISVVEQDLVPGSEQAMDARSPHVHTAAE